MGMMFEFRLTMLLTIQQLAEDSALKEFIVSMVVATDAKLFHLMCEERVSEITRLGEQLPRSKNCLCSFQVSNTPSTKKWTVNMGIRKEPGLNQLKR